MLKVKSRSARSLRLFNIITWCMIIVMVYYIVSRLVSLIIVGETREVLIMETKDFITHKIKAVMCNEILVSDEYLTEDRLIRLTELQKNRKKMSKEDKEIDTYVKKLDDYRYNVESVLAKLKKDVDNSLVSDSNEKKFLKELSKEEKKLLGYESSKKELKDNLLDIKQLEEKKEYNQMISRFFTVDGNTSIDKNIFNPKELLSINNMIKKDKNKPQILLYHTHGSEQYSNSRKGKKEDTVVGVGAYLYDILTNKYGYNVIHNTKSYDVIDGKWNRNSYETALTDLEKVMRDNPSIELAIDIHRDSGKEKVVSNINGVKVAKLMFFNGVSRSKTSNRKDLPNESMKNNIALSLQMQMKSMSLYKNFTKKIYIKGYRYNQHIAKKCMLIEVGNNKNTVEEAKRSMILYAKILDSVLG